MTGFATSRSPALADRGALSFTAYGVPAPQGSTRAFMRPGMKHPVVTADCKRTKPWRQAIVDASREVMAGRAPLGGPVLLDATFFLPRPKSWPKRITEHTTKPDRDKLLRALCDALTDAGVWWDDAQVIEGQTRKYLAAGGHDPEGSRGIPRVVVAVYEVPA